MSERHEAVIRLKGIRLAADGPLLRDYSRPGEAVTQEYAAKYDRTTLIYDAFFDRRRGRAVITAPPFLNLWKPFRDGLRRNGRPVRRMRRHDMASCQQISFPMRNGDAISVELGDRTLHVETRQTLRDRFAGLNCMVTMIRDEPLEWIRNWFGFHRIHHGAEALVLFDNASTIYSSEDLATAVAGFEGMRRHAVYHAPFAFGIDRPREARSLDVVTPVFLQTSMLNLARRDPLADARAVLNTDIDELITSRHGRSVFDMARRRRHRMVKIAGQNIYPGAASGPAAHGQHDSRAVPPQASSKKRCTVPAGFMSRFKWGPHMVGGDLAKLVRVSTEFELLHCVFTSRGWKPGRFEKPRIERDPGLVRLFSETFGDRSPAQPSAASAGKASSSQ